MVIATRSNWLDDGLVVLARAGTTGLRIDRLARALRVTKGSFYHHFVDLADHRRALLAPRKRRPLVGPLMIAVGVVHVGLAPVLFPKSVRSVIDAGVVNSIEADPDLAQLRGLGFWYTTTGLMLIFTGWTVGVLERRAEPTPAALPLFLAGTGAWGAALMPKSPFWVFGGLAALAAVRGARERRTGAPGWSALARSGELPAGRAAQASKLARSMRAVPAPKSSSTGLSAVTVRSRS